MKRPGDGSELSCLDLVKVQEVDRAGGGRPPVPSAVENQLVMGDVNLSCAASCNADSHVDGQCAL